MTYLRPIFAFTISLALFSPRARSETPATRPSTQPSIRTIDVDEFEKLASDPSNVILDVRTPEEFAAGHIANATNIDWQSDDFEQKVSALDKKKTYLVHCAAGGRSAKACKKLDRLSFANVYNLKGGMAAWEKAGKKVEKQ
jgi:rhodanese-related sulfurtransferase